MQRLKISVSLITEDNDYQREQAAVAQAAAQKLDLDLQIQYANNDGVTQSLQLLQAIQAAPEVRPQAIVVEAVGTAMPQVALAAASANIAWVMLNRSVDYLGKLRSITSLPIFCLATDNDAVGQLQGRQINALIAKGKSILQLAGPSTSEVAQQRHSGMLKAKREAIDVKTLRGDWTEGSAHKAVTSWLKLTTSKDLHVALVAAQNDAMALGAHKAIEESANRRERELLLKLPFLGCDGTENKGQKQVRMGILRATIVIPPLTGKALDMLAHAMRSSIQPPEQTLVAPQSYPPLGDL